MRSFLLKIFLFTLFTIVFYCSSIILWGELLQNPSYKKNMHYYIGYYNAMSFRINEISDFKKVDILFLGSSHAYRSFDTRIFSDHGYTSLNFGSSAQTPIQTEMLLEKYLGILQPKLIIYEVYPFTFSLDGLESGLDLLASDRIDLQTVKMVITLNQVKAYNTLIYAYYRQIFNRNKKLKKVYTSGDNTYIHGGFVESKLKYFSGHGSITKDKLIFNNMQLKAFTKSLELIKSRGIPFILVQSPVTKFKYQSWINTKEIDSCFLSNGIMYNFNNLLNLNDSLDFYDADHLNQNGVKIFCDSMIRIIDRKGYVNKAKPDNR